MFYRGDHDILISESDVIDNCVKSIDILSKGEKDALNFYIDDDYDI
ncbi:hypothetical protein [Candidatus Arthromitus sp. SFB-rat-Yit]|nr:hypothetical protein [Candidatus Arthromitus sp. SFB-rat-Yit]